MKPMKRVVVVVDEGPFNTLRVSEAFRMSIGLCVTENRVSLLLILDGVYNLLPLHAEKIGRPSIRDYIDHFEKVGLQCFADADSLLEREISPVLPYAKQLPHSEIIQLILEADVVIPFR